ncbi:MAG: TIGR02281 family clan AA aspartic protease [Burkholderiales bacterium]
MGSLGRKAFMGGNTHMIAAGWVLLLGAMFWFFFDWNERESNPNRNMKATASAEIVLQRSRDGHYYADGEINGRRVNFMLDTGATQIALSRGLANDLGLTLGSSLVLQTAAGPATGYAARLGSVRLGTIEISGLSAVVSEGMRGDIVLLGMNFLKRLEMVQRGDQLTLRPLASGG